MANRFLALVFPPRGLDRQHIQHLSGITTERIGLDPAVELPGLSIFCSKGTICTPIDGDQGAVVGPLFTRAGGGAVTHWDVHAGAGLIASQGQDLIDHYWGHYVAFLKDNRNERVRIVRAPMGTLPVYVLRESALLVLASDAALLVECGILRPGIAWDHLAQHLLTPGLRAESTCLEDVTELRGGCALEHKDGEWVSVPLWSPWPFADRAVRIRNDKDAIESLRETTMAAIRSQTKAFHTSLVSLSGGLDSSIVAACASRSVSSVACLTLVTADPRGDERGFARLMARQIGVPLFEAAESIARIDITRSSADHLPRPVARAFAQSSEAATRDIAMKMGADAILSGGGGDNLFCNMQSVLPVVDRLLTDGPGLGVLASARDMSRIAQTSVAEILKRATRRALRRDPRYRWPHVATCLSRQAIEVGAARAVHPWLEAPERALPGKAAHIAWLMHIENFLEGFDCDPQLRKLSPLMTQPLGELCLRIPTWMWCAGGQDRALARRAFRDLLPAEILARRDKGTHDSFLISIFERNRHVLRGMLADGLLARHGIIDHKTVMHALDAEGPVRGVLYARVMALADAEAWAQAWLSRPHSAH